jgi:hypothetical protein
LTLSTAGLAKDFEGLTVGALAAALGGNGAAAPAKRKVTKRGRPAARKARGGARRGKVDTRTQAGREAYDVSVAAFMQRTGTDRAEDVRTAVGGDPAQIRKAMERLMAAKKVSRTGQKRGTTGRPTTGGRQPGRRRRPRPSGKARAGGRKKKAKVAL